MAKQSRAQTPRPPSPGEPPSQTDRIPIEDNGEPLLDIRAEIPEIDVPETTFYTKEPVLPWLRATVVKQLAKAQALLAPRYRLRISDAYRPLEVQRASYEKVFAETQEKHPAWTPAAVRRYVNRWVAPVDRKTPPPHSTGGAVDLTMLAWDQTEIPMWAEGSDIQATSTIDSPNVSEEIRANRAIMREALEQAGLTNYPMEWWHWSYGDSGWAYRTGADKALYGALEGTPPDVRPIVTGRRTRSSRKS